MHKCRNKFFIYSGNCLPEGRHALSLDDLKDAANTPNLRHTRTIPMDVEASIGILNNTDNILLIDLDTNHLPLLDGVDPGNICVILYFITHTDTVCFPFLTGAEGEGIDGGDWASILGTIDHRNLIVIRMDSLSHLPYILKGSERSDYLRI